MNFVIDKTFQTICLNRYLSEFVLPHIQVITLVFQDEMEYAKFRKNAQHFWQTVYIFIKFIIEFEKEPTEIIIGSEVIHIKTKY